MVFKAFCAYLIEVEYTIIFFLIVSLSFVGLKFSLPTAASLLLIFRSSRHQVLPSLTLWFLAPGWDGTLVFDGVLCFWEPVVFEVVFGIFQV